MLAYSDFGMIRCYTVANEAERRGQLLEEVDLDVV